MFTFTRLKAVYNTKVTYYQSFANEFRYSCFNLYELDTKIDIFLIERNTIRAVSIICNDFTHILLYDIIN